MVRYLSRSSFSAIGEFDFDGGEELLSRSAEKDPHERVRKKARGTLASIEERRKAAEEGR